MISMADMVWASDVEMVINRLATRKHTLADLEYFYHTVNNIEDMRTPDGRDRRLILPEISVWLYIREPSAASPVGACEPLRKATGRLGVPPSMPTLGWVGDVMGRQCDHPECGERYADYSCFSTPYAC